MKSNTELQNQLLEYFWPTPYPRHMPPIEVVFSNDIPKGDRDTDHMSFQISFSMFKLSIEHLIQDHDKALKEKLLEALPERRKFKNGITVTRLDDARVFHFNEALNKVTQAINEVFKEEI